MSDEFYRGHKMICIDQEWFYADTMQLVPEGYDRLCGFCGKPNTKEGHDACLGTLPDVMNACCGHGRNDEAYVQFWDKPTLRGEEAISFFNKNGVGVTIKYCFHHGSEDKEIPATMDLDTEYPKCDECYQYFVDADHNDGGARR